jgi:hypothetical protein
MASSSSSSGTAAPGSLSEIMSLLKESASNKEHPLNKILSGGTSAASHSFASQHSFGLGYTPSAAELDQQARAAGQYGLDADADTALPDFDLESYEPEQQVERTGARDVYTLALDELHSLVERLESALASDAPTHQHQQPPPPPCFDAALQSELERLKVCVRVRAH